MKGRYVEVYSVDLRRGPTWTLYAVALDSTHILEGQKANPDCVCQNCRRHRGEPLEYWERDDG